MKANEIQISDWLYSIIDRGDHTEKKLCKVTGIRTDSDVPLIQCDDTDVWYPLDSYEPIPLTPEILKKNGFIKDSYKDDVLTDVYHLLVPTGFERNSFTIQVSLYREPMCGVSTLVKCWGWLPPYNGGLNDIHLCSANYVHQLQHALRLCGIEKEISLI